MTAEIAIMNRQAVALAADSAVTVSYTDGQKIYNTVNKLFMLSKRAPVGVMVYGVADLTGIPWETIIKCFREDLGNERLPRVRDYATRLLDYIRDHRIMFTEEHQERQLFTSVFMQFRSVMEPIDDEIRTVIESKGGIKPSEMTPIVARHIREAHLLWTNADPLPDVPGNLASRIRRKWRKQIEAIIDYVFGDLSIGPTSRKRLVDIACLVFTASLFPDNVSGLVVAGFGEEEYLPSTIAFDVEGVLLNFVKTRKRPEKSTTITPANSSAVISFAQGEMVSLFMEGVDPTYSAMINHSLEHYVESLADGLVASTGVTGRRERTLRQRIKDASEASTKRFLDNLHDYTMRYHIGPVVSAVTNLPKEELAAMAESLVSLTSFKRRVTHDPETVGGPIDVAVISKGDGFIWIKRKHYFDPGLNHQFFMNYYATLGGDDDVQRGNRV